MLELQWLSSICREFFHIEKTEKININGKEMPEATFFKNADDRPSGPMLFFEWLQCSQLLLPTVMWR